MSPEMLTSLRGKSVVLWGARMTGLGAFRKLSSEQVDVKYFIDSDISLHGKILLGKKVISPKEALDFFQRGLFSAIVITAILKSEDIKASIRELFGAQNALIIAEYGSSDTPSYTIDIMGACNLKCGSCPHSIHDHGVSKGSMSFDTFEKVLRKAMIEQPALSHVSLYSWGDPFLHPHLPQFIKSAHDKSLAVAVSSNLSINLDGRFEEIVDVAPDYLKISVSGFSQGVYETTHQGGDVALVKSNIYKLRHLMDKKGKSFLVDINYHLYRNNKGLELDRFKELAEDVGFVLSETYALVMPLERVINYLDGKPDFQTSRLNDDLLLVSIDQGIEVSGGRKSGVRECTYLTNQVNINADLSVPLCCLTFERSPETIVSRNYLDSSPESILKAKKEMRLCQRCQLEGLPEYNLGFNAAGWRAIAERNLDNHVE
jgi:MoaA/NifB/PqqE/SkfB family radical SAM enzyme